MLVEVHVQLATAYNRLKRTDDAQRERAIIDRLNAEAQAKQRGDKAPRSTMSRRRASAGSRCCCSRSATGGCSPAQTAPAAKAGAASRAGARTRREAAGRTGAGAAEFDRLVKAATEARQAERWEEAIGLYGEGREAEARRTWRATGIRARRTTPSTTTPQCREAFRNVVRLAPKNGAAYAFLGLCEFGLKDYDRSLQHLLQSRILGVGDTQDLGNIARYHAAILMTRMEQYEQALETLGEFAGGGNDNPRVIEAMGLATLRMALLPTEAPPDRREMVLMAGRASYMMATRNTAAAAARRSRRSPRATRKRRTSTTRTAYFCCRSSRTRRSRNSSGSSSCSRGIPRR